ncbi:methionine ABC transporter ATP-binding protein [Candidatus Thiomargarita nelsonii]|uniref:Methionine ABC transporter ATP-binding protein n=1 Tax=Candidatus Thiomargarita nelsonii TaxID=1003181 RepID=A0A0A6PHJ3_9GAMM|nr:methionine ABC transporter ATP-binding protein [Candidatus Thiomargarita nelsonii]
MNPNVIKLHNLRFRWPGQAEDILHIPDMQIHQGEHLFIQGSSGSGKTTLLNIISGINCPNAGTVQVLDTALANLSTIQRDQFRVDHLGVIFQQFNLLPYLSLLENVQLPCWFSHKRKAQAGDEAALRLLDELQIPKHLVNKPVNALSVGQQQRVAVARALIGRPEIIIADEPTSALDTNNRNRFLELLFSEANQQGSTLVFVSHDPHIAQKFSRVIELSDINHAGETII